MVAPHDNETRPDIVAAKRTAIVAAGVQIHGAKRRRRGYDNSNQVTDTPLGTNFTAIAGGDIHSLALSAAAVPEPATAAMVLLGAGGLICRRRAA